MVAREKRSHPLLTVAMGKANIRGRGYAIQIRAHMADMAATDSGTAAEVGREIILKLTASS